MNSIEPSVIPAQAGIKLPEQAGSHKEYYVYIVGNHRPTLYVGVTNNLVRRVFEHKHGYIQGFTKKYGLDKLLYFERFSDPREAILREKRIKKWKREWKLELIKGLNPALKDLYGDII